MLKTGSLVGPRRNTSTPQVVLGALRLVRTSCLKWLHCSSDLTTPKRERPTSELGRPPPSRILCGWKRGRRAGRAAPAACGLPRSGGRGRPAARRGKTARKGRETPARPAETSREGRPPSRGPVAPCGAARPGGSEKTWRSSPSASRRRAELLPPPPPRLPPPGSAVCRRRRPPTGGNMITDGFLAM